MNNNKIIVLLGLMAALMSCGKDKDNKSGKDIKSNDAQYEMSEPDVRRPIFSNNGQQRPANTAATLSSDTSSSSFYQGPQMLPNGPVLPPVATDDDFFGDEPFGVFDDLLQPFNPGLAVCGNLFVEIIEQCDDGNAVAGDGCNVLCLFEICGNGYLDFNEECDDGLPPADGDGCSAICEFEKCGNEIIDPGEECDDGNLIPGDGCSPCCLFERCGNKIIDPIRIFMGNTLENETCDDGNLKNGDGCSDCCVLEVCGDNYATPNEECEDGNVIDGDGCSSKCKIEGSDDDDDDDNNNDDEDNSREIETETPEEN